MIDPIKILPLGGLGEIGMNCMVIEYRDEIVLIDCGLLFSDLDHFGVEFVIPDFSYLKHKLANVKAIWITHGHEDHIGALGFALKYGIQAPIYASYFTSLMIRERLKELNLEREADLRTVAMGETIAFQYLKVTPTSVNHSILDATALFIDTPHGKIIHTGDFKLDASPFFGQVIDHELFKKAGDEGVLLLLSDSTNVEKRQPNVAETKIYHQFEQLFQAAQGLIVVSMFSSNVGRIAQIVDLAKKMNKKICLAGRSMEQNVRLAREAHYLNLAPQQLIDLDQLHRYDRSQVILISTGSQGEPRSALTRVANGEHSQIKLQTGDLVLLSSKFIPGNEKAIGRTINQLFKQGVEVLYEAVNEIHASGHATRQELGEMLDWVRPKFFIPVHGEYRHLVLHGQLAEERGVAPDNILIAVDGDGIELTPDRAEIVFHLDDTRLLIEDREGQDISKHLLKERKQLGEKGVVFVLLVRNSETGRIMSSPEVISRGLLHESHLKRLSESAKQCVQRQILRYELARVGEESRELDLREMIRVELRRFFQEQTGKKPTVLPVILEL